VNKALSAKAARLRTKSASVIGNSNLGWETAAEQKQLQPLLRGKSAVEMVLK